MKTIELIAGRDIQVEGQLVKEAQVLATIESKYSLGSIQSLLRSAHVVYKDVTPDNIPKITSAAPVPDMTSAKPTKASGGKPGK